MRKDSSRSKGPARPKNKFSSSTGKSTSKSAGKSGPGKPKSGGKTFGSRSPKSFGDKPYSPRSEESSDRKPRNPSFGTKRDGDFKKDFSKKDGAFDGKKTFGSRPPKSFGDKPYSPRNEEESDRKPRNSSFGEKRGGDFKKEYPKKDGAFDGKKTFGSRPPKSFGDKPYSPRIDEASDRKPRNSSFGEKRGGDFKKEYPKKDGAFDGKKTFEKRTPKSFGDKPYTPRNEESGDRKPRTSSFGDKRGGDFKKEYPKKDGAFDGKKPYEKSTPKSFGDKPYTPRNDESNDRKPRTSSFGDKRGGDFKKEYPKKDGAFDGKKTFEKRTPKSFGDKPYKPKAIDSDNITDEDAMYVEKDDSSKPTKSARKKPVAKQAEDGQIRLNRFISNSGLCSRRDADELITQGLIAVNGTVITELGYKVLPLDAVKYEGRLLRPERMAYVLLNKPKDFITTMDDPEDRKTVMDLVKNACKERVYPVGRLDRNTTGLLLLTNDGELAERLTHPSHQISKIYQVDLDKPITDADMNKIVAGVHLEDGLLKVIDVAIVSPDKKILGVEISEGRNRVVRRLFETLGYDVVRLDRVSYAGLTKKDLPRGNYRLLTDKEVAKLKYSSNK